MKEKTPEILWKEKCDEVAKISDSGISRSDLIDPGIINAVTAIQILEIPTVGSCEGHVIPVPEDEITGTGQVPGIPMIVCGVHPRSYGDYIDEKVFEDYIKRILPTEQLNYIDELVRKNTKYIRRAGKILDAFYTQRQDVLNSERLMIETSFNWYWRAFTITLQLRTQELIMDMSELRPIVIVGQREFAALTDFIRTKFFNGELNKTVS